VWHCDSIWLLCIPRFHSWLAPRWVSARSLARVLPLLPLLPFLQISHIYIWLKVHLWRNEWLAGWNIPTSAAAVPRIFYLIFRRALSMPPSLHWNWLHLPLLHWAIAHYQVRICDSIVGYLRFQVPDYLFQVGDLRVLWPARGYERLLATLLNGPWHSNQRPSARETVIYCPRLWSEQSAINKSHTLWWPGGKQFQAAINGRPQNN